MRHLVGLLEFQLCNLTQVYNSADASADVGLDEVDDYDTGGVSAKATQMDVWVADLDSRMPPECQTETAMDLRLVKTFHMMASRFCYWVAWHWQWLAWQMQTVLPRFLLVNVGNTD